MTYEQALTVATDYVTSKGVDHFGVNQHYVLIDTNVKDLFILDVDFPDGVRSKVWQFNFAGYESKPNMVVSGGIFVVFVDEDTGRCGSRVGI
jgi:hypothetical protein